VFHVVAVGNGGPCNPWFIQSRIAIGALLDVNGLLMCCGATCPPPLCCRDLQWGQPPNSFCFGQAAQLSGAALGGSSTPFYPPAPVARSPSWPCRRSQKPRNLGTARRPS
jgi:hypothetical protein